MAKKIIFIIVTLVAASCSVLKKERFPDLKPDQGLYRDLDKGDSTNMAGISWKDLFADTILQNIITTALENNYDLRIAEARMDKAAAGLMQARLAFFPSLGAVFNASYQSQGIGVPESYQLLGNTSWETGIWGRQRSLRKAALASYRQSEAFRRAVQTQLVATIATNYFTLLAMDRKLEITEMTLARRIKNEETMKVMKDNDIITGADLVLSQANRYAAEVIIPDLKRGIFELENTLSLLQGMNPGPIRRNKLDDQKLPSDLNAGVPAQLLSNRPDVLQAEYRVREAFEMVKAAKTNFYPSLRLTASYGIASKSLQGLFGTPLIVWNLLGNITQPIFENGLNRTRLVAARSDQQEAVAIFYKTLLTAGEEVVNALNAYQTASEKVTIRARQIEYLEKSVEFTNELLKYTNTTNYTDVLTAEVNLLSAQLNGVNDTLEQMQAVIALYQSLGGGYR